MHLAYRKSIDELYDTVAALEKLGNKNLVIDAATTLSKRLMPSLFSSVRPLSKTATEPAVIRLW